MTEQTLSALAVDYKAIVDAVNNHSNPDVDFDQLVDDEISIARRIAFVPAITIDDLAIKAVVMLREIGTNKFKVGDPGDYSAMLKVFDDQDRPDLAKLINVSTALDIMRLSGKAVNP